MQASSRGLAGPPGPGPGMAGLDHLDLELQQQLQLQQQGTTISIYLGNQQVVDCINPHLYSLQV